jgi:hypothetical protein
MKTSAPLVYHQSSDEDVLTVIYCLIDTIVRSLNTRRLKPKGTAGRKAKLTESELVTLAIFRFHLGFPTLKHTYLPIIQIPEYHFVIRV